jgi:pSer/pThr/pTyr-binding forkhead associated (FHA) protein
MDRPKRTTDVVSRDEPPFGSPWVVVLAVIAGPNSNAVHRMVAKDTVVGTSETEADFVLNDPQVSRRHLLIRVNGGLFSLIDQNSSNGTVLNANPVSPGKPVRLKHLDEIALGRTRLLFMACKHREAP